MSSQILHGVYVFEHVPFHYPLDGDYVMITSHLTPIFYVRENYLTDEYMGYYGFSIERSETGEVVKIYYHGVTGAKLAAYDKYRAENDGWYAVAYKALCFTEPVVIDSETALLFSTSAAKMETRPPSITVKYRIGSGTPITSYTYKGDRISLPNISENFYVESWNYYNESRRTPYGTAREGALVYENVTILATVKEKLSPPSPGDGYINGITGWGVKKSTVEYLLEKGYSQGVVTTIEGYNPIDIIHNCIVFPFNIEVDTKYAPTSNRDFLGYNVWDNIAPGEPSSHARGGLILDTNNKKKICKIIPIKMYNDFRDYSSTSIQIYLPFKGFVTIDANIFYLYEYFILYLAVDYLSGNGMYYLEASDGYQIGYWNVKIGINLPIINSNNDEIVRNGFASVQKTISSIFNGESPNSLSNLQHYLTIQPTYSVENNSGDFTQSAMIYRPFVRYTYLEMNNDSNFEYVGRVCKRNVSLSSLEGYAEIGDIHLENINATQDELDEIVALLKSGVIF